MKNIVYATTNPGKISEVQSLYAHVGIQVISPADVGLNLIIQESGTTLEENAILKAEGYRDALDEGYLVLADDTGLEIDALYGEPGIKVRRWKGYPMTDQELVDYCLARLAKIPEGKRTAHFRTVIAITQKGSKTIVVEGKLDGEIVTQPGSLTIPGFPFEALFYVTEYGKLLGEIYALPASLREQFTTHRHRAVNATLPYLHSLLGTN